MWAGAGCRGASCIWLHTQRRAYKRGTLETQRAQILEAAGVVWSPRYDCWTGLEEEIMDWDEEAMFDFDAADLDME